MPRKPLIGNGAEPKARRHAGTKARSDEPPKPTRRKVPPKGTPPKRSATPKRKTKPKPTGQATFNGRACSPLSADTSAPAPGSAPGPGGMPYQQVPVTKLNAAPYNPRVRLQPGDPEYERLKRSIAEFGLVEPIVWNRQTGHVVGGHQRLNVLIAEHGVTEVDAVVVDLPLPAEKALNVALNKITGRWDEQALGELLADLQADDTIDALLTGFDNDEITALIESAAPAPGSTGDDAANEGPTSGGGGVALQDGFQIVVLCESEAQQAQLFTRLKADGYKCRAHTIH